MLSFANSTLWITNNTFANSNYQSDSAIASQDSSIYASDINFLENSGNDIVDMHITCSNPTDVVFNNIIISSTNSVPNSNIFASTTSVLIDGCNLYVSDWTFSECFSREESYGRLLAIQSTSSKNTIINFNRLEASHSGWGSSSEESLVYINAQNNMNVTILDSYFSHCSVNDIHNTVEVHVTDTSAISIHSTTFLNVTNGLYLSGPSYVKNCTFIGSEDTQSAISVIGEQQTIIDCTFTNFINVAMILTEVNGTISGCTFTNNTGDFNGGGLSISNSYIEISNCNWINNRAVTEGGGLYIFNSDVFIDNSEFIENSVPFHNGGAISLASESSVTINNSLFLNNNAAYGGAIYLGGGSSLTIQSSEISYNTAIQAGGGLFFQNHGFTNVINCTISSNHCAHGNGGGLSTHFLASPIIDNCYIFNNSATSGGGISITDGTAPTISNCTILNNSASSSGGGIVIQGLSVPIVKDCTINNNFANSTGGGVIVRDIATPEFKNCYIENNESPNEGGAVVFTDKSFSSFQKCTIRNNESGGSGGGFAFGITAAGEFFDLSLENNFASSSGGAMSFHNEVTPSFNHIVFNNNSASEGGAINIEDTASPEFTNCLLVNNTALSHGGGIVASDFTNSSFHSTIFMNNSAPSGRGGVAKIDDFSITRFSNCSFINNYADSGGSIYVSSINGPNISSTIFQSNHARLHGGALLFAGKSYGIIKNTTLEYNSADESGGGILFQDEAIPYLEDVDFINNNVVLGYDGLGEGGAFSVWDKAGPQLFECFIYNNTGLLGGGASIHELANLHMENSLFQENTATNGGGIFLQGFRSSMINTIFEENRSDFGGAIYLQTSLSFAETDICNNCTFVKNIAKTSGGALFFRTLFDFSEKDYDNSNNDNSINYDIVPISNNRTSYTFTNPIFINNTALRGGAIYYSDGFSLVNFGPTCIIKNNSAGEFGGGLYINQFRNSDDTTIWMTGANFTGNNAYYAGVNVGWNFVDPPNAGIFCDNCIWDVIDNYDGYETEEEGWATPPSNLIFENSCPSSLYVSSDPFEVSTQLIDLFSTSVTGHIDIDNNVTISLGTHGNCEIITDNTLIPVNSTSGIALFSNLTIEGKDKESCQLIFSIPIMRNVFIPPAVCNISIYGCPDGQTVSSNSNGYDTCIPSSGNTGYEAKGYIRFFLIFIALLLVCIICTVLSVACGKFVKKKYKRYKLLRTMIPDLERKPLVSLESILNDKDIPHISWNELQIRDRIGVGANGIVSRGLWFPESKKTLKKYQKSKNDPNGGIEIAVKELLVEQIELLNPITLEEFLIEIKFLRYVYSLY